LIFLIQVSQNYFGISSDGGAEKSYSNRKLKPRILWSSKHTR